MFLFPLFLPRSLFLPIPPYPTLFLTIPCYPPIYHPILPYPHLFPLFTPVLFLLLHMPPIPPHSSPSLPIRPNSIIFPIIPPDFL